MALGMNTGGGGGNFNAVCKYNAKAGRMYRIDRTDDGAGNYTNDEVEITEGFQAVFDLENIEVGWAKFVKGMAPDWRMVKLGEPWPDRPGDKDTTGKPLYKNTFRMMIKLGSASGGDVREFASSAGCVIGAIDGLHDEYTAAKAANPGKLPVVAMTKTMKIAGKGGDNNFAPVFAIVKWVPRPPELVGGVPANEPKQEPVQQLKPATQVAPQPIPEGEDF